MVAVANAAPTGQDAPVTLLAGEEASGLARIVGQYLEQLLADSPEKRAEAAALRGRLGLHAREGDIAVTVVFDEGGISIEEELRSPDAVIGGEIEFLMHVLAGRANPAWEMCRGTLSIRPNVRRPFFAYRAYRLMRLPGVYPWSGLPRTPVLLALSTAIGVGALLVVRRRRQRSSGGDDG